MVDKSVVIKTVFIGKGICGVCHGMAHAKKVTCEPCVNEGWVPIYNCEDQAEADRWTTEWEERKEAIDNGTFGEAEIAVIEAAKPPEHRGAELFAGAAIAATSFLRR